VKGLDVNQIYSRKHCAINAAGFDVSKEKAWWLFSVPLTKQRQSLLRCATSVANSSNWQTYLKRNTGDHRAHGRCYEQIAQHLHNAGIYVSALNPNL